MSGRPAAKEGFRVAPPRRFIDRDHRKRTRIVDQGYGFANVDVIESRKCDDLADTGGID